MVPPVHLEILGKHDKYCSLILTVETLDLHSTRMRMTIDIICVEDKPEVKKTQMTLVLPAKICGKTLRRYKTNAHCSCM